MFIHQFIHSFRFVQLYLFLILSLSALSVISDDAAKTESVKESTPKMIDPELSMEATKKFPANQWVVSDSIILIPEKWKQGRYCYINSYASIIFCESLNVAMTMDGFTYTPAGKSVVNNYSDSVYAFDPMKNEYELFKRSNWRAGARSTDIEHTSYPLDENKTDPTPCPRHIYKGITWLADTNLFYLINGANAGVPNKHPKYTENNGTDTRTFWAMDVSTRTWKQLENPPLKRIDPYETILTAIPGTGKLIYLDDWGIASYDTKESKWSVKLGEGRSPIKALQNGSATLVDAKRRRIVFFGGNAWRPVKEAAPLMAKNQLHIYDTEKNTLEIINGSGSVEFEKIRPCAYIRDMDKYFYLTDKGHYLFDPVTNQWKKLKIEMPKVPLQWCYMTYDTKRGLVIINDGMKWGVLRLDEKTFEYE